VAEIPFQSLLRWGNQEDQELLQFLAPHLS